MGTSPRAFTLLPRFEERKRLSHPKREHCLGASRFGPTGRYHPSDSARRFLYALSNPFVLLSCVETEPGSCNSGRID